MRGTAPRAFFLAVFIKLRVLLAVLITKGAELE